MKPCVYILISKKDGNRYIGSTINLLERIKQHEKGQVKSTKNRRPLVLYATREFDNITEAVIFEKKYKNSSGQIHRDIRKGKLIIRRGVA